MARRTFNLDRDLINDFHNYASRSGRTMDAAVEDALREVLARRRYGSGQVIELPISPHRGGALPGIDLIKTSSLLDPFEKYRDPADSIVDGDPG